MSQRDLQLVVETGWPIGHNPDDPDDEMTVLLRLEEAGRSVMTMSFTPRQWWLLISGTRPARVLAEVSEEIRLPADA